MKSEQELCLDMRVLLFVVIIVLLLFCFSLFRRQATYINA